MEFYEVGGCVRDEIMGVQSKDIDFTVTLDPEEVTPRRAKSGKLIERDAFDVMRDELVRRGFEIFVETPKFLTIRAKFPKASGHPALIRHGERGLTADFVLARKESEYTDGRRPDKVEPGTLIEDLARRDFTMNAIAKNSQGNLIDPFGGVGDIQTRTIRCVGSAENRFCEDALRALRAIRFAVTKGMTLDGAVVDALASDWLPGLLGSVSVERRAQELQKAFKFSTLETLTRLRAFPKLEEVIFTDGLWLEPSLKGKAPNPDKAKAARQAYLDSLAPGGTPMRMPDRCFLKS
jgi:tRNA nucleotidyltransferase/poly(A) polymerase